MADQLCPCGSGKLYADCCAPYIEQGASAPDAPTLARSRYTAFALQRYPYLVESTHPDFRGDLTAESLGEGLEAVQWTGLELGEYKQGVAVPDQGVFDSVELKAFCEVKGVQRVLEELSFFTEHEGRLYYVDGIPQKEEPRRRAEPKVGRNEPCPCGSGKKYKKCCGAA